MADDKDKLFSPSLWSRRLPQDVVVQEFIRLTSEQTALAQQSIPCELQLRYGPAERETVDVYGTDLPDDSPIFVYFPGGYWQECSSSDSGYPSEPLRDAGIKTIVVDYERAPGVSLTEIVDQAIRAAQWVLEYAKLKNSRSILIGGHSAGSQLCGMLLASEWFASLDPNHRSLFLGVFFISGVFDVQALLETSILAPLKVSHAEARAMSPAAQPNLDSFVKNCPDMNISFFVAENEAPGLVEQGKSFYKALKEKGLCKVEYQTVPMVDHFDLVEKLCRPGYVLTKAIINTLNP